MMVYQTVKVESSNSVNDCNKGTRFFLFLRLCQVGFKYGEY